MLQARSRKLFFSFGHIERNGISNVNVVDGAVAHFDGALAFRPMRSRRDGLARGRCGFVPDCG